MDTESIYTNHLSYQPETLIEQELSTHIISKHKGMPTSELPPEPMSAPLMSGEWVLMVLVLVYWGVKRLRLQ